ncbi:MAG: exo-alpha-sialidase [Alistipes sp.]|nr:exo-alpha-sialidase [Alistipes sp.]MBR5131183.1 exo-alpha-sialidase [Alistipes sp.]
MRNINFLWAIVCGIATFACSCTPPETPTPEPEPQKPAAERFEVFPLLNPSDIPYRIPALAAANDGTLIAIADYRHSGTDIGVTNYGRIDLHYRLSTDNGNTWSEIMPLIEGKGAESPDFMNVGYGDPCIVADRESSRVLVMSCAGNVSFHNGTRLNHQNIARFYSEDCGKTWSDPEDIAESIYSQFDSSTYGPVRSMFVASGRIMQSRITKVGDYYRLYCAVLVKDRSQKHMNYVLFSDDFGGSWKVLGNINEPAVYNTADEPKVEELPDGTLLISSRYNGGRYYNLFTYTDVNSGAGVWDNAAFSGASNNGVESKDNSTNGEVMLIPVTRVADNKAMHVLLQSVPLGPERKNVGIYYKEIASFEDYVSPMEVAQNWDGVTQITTLNSAYSTMAWQKDNRLGFLYEEETHGSSNLAYGGYTIVYECFDIESLTEGKYTYRK